VTTLLPDELARVRNEYIGFVFQNFNLLPKRNILDNVMLPLMYRGMPISERENKAREMLKLVGLENFETYLPTQLSGGMKQRVAIARALAGNPKIILADEPTGALDSKMGNEILRFFKKLNKEMGITIVMITHEFEIAQYANRIIHIYDGRIVYDGVVPKSESVLIKSEQKARKK
jgi:putative ABC transport system ATP-binding protein